MRRQQPLRVEAEPAFRTRHANPYNSRLYEELQGLGVHVRDLSYVRMFLRPPDVFHLHWPELTFLSGYRKWRVVARIALFFAALRLARRRGARLVWTVHNVNPHERRWSEQFTGRFWRLFTRNVDGVLALSASGGEAARSAHEELRDVPVFVTPHGHYRQDYDLSMSREQARAMLGIPAEARVVAFTGQIRRYKNVPALARAFRELAGDDLRLVVAGAGADAGTTGELESSAAADDRLLLDLSFLPDERLVACLRAADLVVLPFTAILNSGSALLALSADRPVLLPQLGALGELQDVVGERWVRTYDGELTPEVLAAAVAWAVEGGRPEVAPLEELSWDIVARRTLEAYTAVVESPRPGR